MFWPSENNAKNFSYNEIVLIEWFYLHMSGKIKLVPESVEVNEEGPPNFFRFRKDSRKSFFVRTFYVAPLQGHGFRWWRIEHLS